MKDLPKNFWLLSFSLFFFMVSFNAIIPELNQFITQLGGENSKGLIITLFTISAAISRPFSGKLSDTIGRKKVILFGGAIAIIITLLYPLSLSVYFFLTLRFLHGFAAGFLPTGATALVTDILPENKRGYGMGIWGVFISLGIGFGQYAGSMIASQYGLNNLFFFATAFAVISILLQLGLKETLAQTQTFKFSLLKIKWKDIIEPSVIPSALVMFLTAICSGIVFVIVPDLAHFVGIENKGSFFGIYVLSTIVIRLASGRISDRIGRANMMIISVSMLALSMLLVGITTDIHSFILAAIVFGVATGLSSPTLFAWTADLSDIDRRGVGSGTMFIALELGIMIGSYSTMFIYNNQLNSIWQTTFIGIASCLFALVYLIFHQLKKRKIKQLNKP